MATPKPSSALSLTRTEVTFCKKRAEESGLNGQRAKALLTIHQGETQAKAVENSGLTLGQVRYIIGRFRLHRTQALQADLQGPAANTITPDAEAKKSTAKNKKAKAKLKDKDKKGKKDKNKDKKKAKSDKKSKKDRKSKKKKSKK